ncbi:hypothetical protein BDZ97DRAFT_260519 [Flammula alnicola]|nr:hypothetical protein BDZ97DRAFT_260519 [Flammula alnicola]
MAIQSIALFVLKVYESTFAVLGTQILLLLALLLTLALFLFLSILLVVLVAIAIIISDLLPAFIFIHISRVGTTVLSFAQRGCFGNDTILGAIPSRFDWRNRGSCIICKIHFVMANSAPGVPHIHITVDKSDPRQC